MIDPGQPSQQATAQLAELLDATISLHVDTVPAEILPLAANKALGLCQGRYAIAKLTLPPPWNQVATAGQADPVSLALARWLEAQGVVESIYQKQVALRFDQAGLAALIEQKGGWEGSLEGLPEGWLAAPFIRRDRHNMGVLQVFGRQGEAFTQADQTLLCQLARLTAMAVDNTRLLGAEQHARQVAETLRVASMHLAQDLELDAVLEALLDYLAWLVPYDAACVMLCEGVDPGTIRAYRDFTADNADSRAGILDSQISPMVYTLLSKHESILISDTSQHRWWTSRFGPNYQRSWLGVPLVADHEPIGLFLVEKTEPNRFTEEHVRWAEALATQAVVAIQNARLFAALSASEERYRAATELTSDYAYAYRIDPTGELAQEWVTEAFHRITGYQPEETSGRGGWLNRVYPEDQPLALQHLRLLFSGQQSVTEYRIVTRDGEVRWLRDHCRPVWDEKQQRVVRIYGAAQDITGSKEAEESLVRRASDLEALAELSAELRVARTAEEMISGFLQKVTAAVQARAAMVYLTETKTGDLVMRCSYPPTAAPAMMRLQVGESLAGRAAASGKLQRFFEIDQTTSSGLDVLGQPEHIPHLNIAIPLRTQDHVVGVLQLELGEPGQITSVEEHLLIAMAEMAGNSLHRALLHEQTEQRLGRLSTLRAIDLIITTSLDLRVTLNLFLDQVLAQLGCDAADILLFNSHTQFLEFAASRGFRTESITHSRLRLGEGLAGMAALEGRTVHSPVLPANSVPLARAVMMAEESFCTHYVAPLIAKGQVQGVMEVFHRSVFETDPEWLDFLETLAGQAAIAIDNSSLFNDLQRSNRELALAYDTTLEGWSRALDLRDKETEGHTQRVTEMTLKLARSAGIGEAELVHIRRGALLHDIGKMAISDTILLKPGPLTVEEQVIMSQHPVYAYQLLAPIGYLRPALDIPYCHHEKWDGTGYPRGLKGEQIPLAARLFTVADVWDALNSDRPYRKKWPQDQVRNYIQSLAGIHFDPQVVKLFWKVLDEGEDDPGSQ